MEAVGTMKTGITVTQRMMICPAALTPVHVALVKARRDRKEGANQISQLLECTTKKMFSFSQENVLSVQ